MIPVTVLTGFLGSGKTTLLNRILSEQHGKKIAVIENEFGEIGVDNKLVIQSDEELFEMNNGCICCKVRGDLIRILGRLMKRKDKLDGIIIETTGLADPGPVAQTFFTDDEMKAAFRLDAIITVVDTKHISLHLDQGDESKAQVAFADVILLNKTDLVSPEELASLEARIRKINGAAKIHRTLNCDIPLDKVLDVGGFNLSRATELDTSFLEPDYPFEWSGAYELQIGTYELSLGGHHDHAGHDHGHDHHHHGAEDSIDIAVLPVKSLEPKELATTIDTAVRVFSDWETIIKPGETILPGPTLQRLKLDGDHGHYPVKIEKAGRYIFFTGHDVPTHLYDENKSVLRYEWDRDYHHSHSHNDDVTSVGITTPGDLDGKRLNDWINELLRVQGGNIYRMKGVLSVKGSDKRLVFQGVHMLFDAKFDRPWGTDERENRLIFIGKKLDRTALNEAFKSCLA